jgi:hypothetical protein
MILFLIFSVVLIWFIVAPRKIESNFRVTRQWKKAHETKIRGVYVCDEEYEQ